MTVSNEINLIQIVVAQLAVTVEYTDCFSADG